MLENTFDLRLSEPDIDLIGKLTIAGDLFLAMVTVIATLNVLGWMLPAARGLFRAGWSPMSVEAATATLLIAASLTLSRPRYNSRIQTLSMGIAIVVAISSAMLLAGQVAHSTHALFSVTAAWAGKGMMPLASACFVLLGFTTAVIRTRRHIGALADFFTFCLLFIVAVLVSAEVLGVLGIFGPVLSFATSGQTAFCLLLLAMVVFFRRAENGVFSLLLGRGIGSKILRLLAPLLVVLPYFREAMRANLFGVQRLPPHYVTALMATVAMAVSIALLMYLAWRLNALETEIQGLSLRDPLTGLYNLRGFRLLAEQALLLAHRSGQPYSVLFIDVDNLKQINDALGHQAGSELLAATADILRGVFRETDVLGRMGGDEFAVAGQFSGPGIADAAERLRQASMLYNADASRATLRFSAGWASCGAEKREPLADLLAKADEEMYREKRRRKAAGAGRLKTSPEADLARLVQHEGGEGSKLREAGNL